ncbi:hypothetical protein [Aurantimonas coralicida]|uniref:hypothetical protein n=1 Tax=Aurantimonas coralicida TaxID=182270 RepID=UPI0023994EC7|nr:hypothetical protein [Aurantimonas coralicida]MDE0922371.1 hypothetical protein [Aurantimonas coralicida]
MVTEFGPGVIQTPQSPFGQLNGLLADIITELWEIGLQAYQARDPDQAEQVNLDALGRYRLVSRNGASDEAFRQRITNAGQARVDVQDIEAAVSSIPGVTYAMVFVNGGGEIDDNGIPAGGLSIAVIGGDDDAVADTIRMFLVPGTITYGNAVLNSMIGGYCRSLYIVRPIDIPVTLHVQIRLSRDRFNCPAPSPTAIRNGLVEDWQTFRANGKDVTFYAVRQLIESRHDGVEVVSISAERDGLGASGSATIGFIEIASLTTDDVTIEVI